MPPKKTLCGNPLFLSWMEELRDTAREKNMKSAETYSKACRSLGACPVTYNRPRDLVCLQGIGPKIVSILEKKWLEYCLDNGLPLPGSPPKGKAKARTSSGSDIEIRDLDNSDAEGSGGGGGVDKPPPKKKKKATTSKPKTYIPQKGSGGYGILLALVLAIENPTRNTQVFLTKSEVIRLGQPFSDASYTHSEKGTYFNAWSSMKTLVGKGYVYVTGNPHKYCLTEEGYEVACAIRNLQPEYAHLEKHPFLHEPVADDIPLTQTRPIARKESRLSHTPSQAGPSTLSPPRAQIGTSTAGSTSRFNFWYISSTGDRVSEMINAMIRLDHTSFTNLRKIEYRASQAYHPFARQLKLVDKSPLVRDGSGLETLYGFIGEEEAPPICSRFQDDDTTKLKGASKRDTQIGGQRDGSKAKKDTWLDEPMLLDDDEDEDGYVSETLRTNGYTTNSVRSAVPDISSLDTSAFGRTTSLPTQTGRSTTANLAAEAAARRLGQAGSSRTTSAAADFALPSNASTKPTVSAPRLSRHLPTPSASVEPESLGSTSTTPHFDPSNAIIFPRGEYEIILIVDTREVESKLNRDKIAEALKDKGIKVETRALRLGDMCWVARRLDGLGGEEDECVLDYVAERKRLDDLCISIRDGRYADQCFRLTNSCISHVYYIVEDWQVTERMAYDGLQIMTAKSQVQVHNRFFLKETHKLSETIDFLATMTNVIQDLHQSSDLHVIPTRCLSRSSYGSLQSRLKISRPDITFLTSFQAFQDLNDKSSSKTLREKFARMLLCVKGMSAERVSAVLDNWETPKSLWVDLKAHREEFKRKRMDGEFDDDILDGLQAKQKKAKKVREEDMFFADRVQGEGRRKIGDALSRELYRVLMRSESSTS